MTQSDAPRPHGAYTMHPQSSSPKALRSDLVRIDIAARRCTQLLPRVLGLVALHDAIPTTIDYAVDDAIRLSITVDIPDRRVPLLMAAAIRRIISVEEVVLCDQNGPVLDASPAPLFDRPDGPDQES